MKIQQLINICSNFNQMLFWQYCMLCNAASAESHGLCPACAEDLPDLPSAHCPQCALLSPEAHICGHCLRSPPAFDRTFALFSYEYPVDAMLQRYKYQHRLSMAARFAELMAAG